MGWMVDSPWVWGIFGSGANAEGVKNAEKNFSFKLSDGQPKVISEHFQQRQRICRWQKCRKMEMGDNAESANVIKWEDVQ
jgi:hypothetical protein